MAEPNTSCKQPYLPPHIVSTPVVLVEELLAQAYLQKARQWAAASSAYLRAPPASPRAQR